MPTVSKGGRGQQQGQTNQNSEHTKEQTAQRVGDGFPRDDISGAYAGNQHESKKFNTEEHATHLKARKTKEGREKSPKN